MLSLEDLFTNSDCANRLLGYLTIEECLHLMFVNRFLWSFMSSRWIPERIVFGPTFRKQLPYKGPDFQSVVKNEERRLAPTNVPTNSNENLEAGNTTGNDQVQAWRAKRQNEETRKRLDRVHIAGPCACLIYLAYSHYIFNSFNLCPLTRLLNRSAGQLKHLKHPKGLSHVHLPPMEVPPKRRLSLVLGHSVQENPYSEPIEAFYDSSLFDLFCVIVNNRQTLESIDIHADSGLPSVDIGGMPLCPKTFFKGPLLDYMKPGQSALQGSVHVECLQLENCTELFHTVCWRRIIEGLTNREEKAFPCLRTLRLRGRVTTPLIMLFKYFGFVLFPSLREIDLQGYLSSAIQSTVHFGQPQVNNYWRAVCGTSAHSRSPSFLTEDLCQMLLLSSNLLEPSPLSTPSSESPRQAYWQGVFRAWFDPGNFPSLCLARVRDEGVHAALGSEHNFSVLPSRCIAGWLRDLPRLDTLILDRDQTDLLTADCEALFKWALLLPNPITPYTEARTPITPPYKCLRTLVISRPRLLDSLLPLQESVSLHLGHFVTLKIEELQVQIASPFFMRNLHWLSQWEFHQREMFRRMQRIKLLEAPTETTPSRHVFYGSSVLKLNFQDLQMFTQLNSFGANPFGADNALLKRLFSRKRRLRLSSRWPPRIESVADPAETPWDINIPGIELLHLLKFNPLLDEHLRLLEHLKLEPQFLRKPVVTTRKLPIGDVFERESVSNQSRLERVIVEFDLEFHESHTKAEKQELLLAAVQKFRIASKNIAWLNQCRRIFVDPVCCEGFLNMKDWEWWKSLIEN